jgi:hypothetical protein
VTRKRAAQFVGTGKLGERRRAVPRRYRAEKNLADERQAIPQWLDFPAQSLDELRGLVESSYFLAR